MGEGRGEPGAGGGAKKKPSGAQRRKEQKAKEEAIAASRMALEATEAAARAVLPVGDEDELAAMQHVMRSPVDRTYQHYQLRRIWEKTPDEFRKEYFSLIRAKMRAGRSSDTPAPPSPESKPGSGPAGTSGQTDSSTDHIPPVLRELLAPEFAEIEEYHRHREEFLKWRAAQTSTP